jgi:membrane protease YdiL (CAAX protease family)
MPTSVEKPSISQPSPLSPTLWAADAFAWPRSLAVLALLALAFYAGLVLDSYVAYRLLGTTVQNVKNSQLTWGLAIGQYVSYVPVLAAVAGALPWLARRSWRELGLRALDARALGTGLLGAVAMYAVTIGIADAEYALTRNKPEEASIALFTSTHDPLLLATFTLLASVAAPFVEELVFRGFLFNALLRYLPVWAAAIVSGALFGLSHGSPSAALPLAGSGVVLAYVYHRTGSLTAAMITHATFNLLNIALLSVVKA